MKYWFGTINIYVWTIKNPFLITKTYENYENTSNFQFLMKIFFRKIKKSRILILTLPKWSEKYQEFDGTNEKSPNPQIRS